MKISLHLQVETPSPILPVPPAPIISVTTHDAGVQSSPVASEQVAISDMPEISSVSDRPTATEALQQGPRHSFVPLSNITEASSNLSNTREERSSVRDDEIRIIPRAGFSQAFRRMKKLLFVKSSPPPRRVSVTNSLDLSPKQ